MDVSSFKDKTWEPLFDYREGAKLVFLGRQVELHLGRSVDEVVLDVARDGGDVTRLLVQRDRSSPEAEALFVALTSYETEVQQSWALLEMAQQRSKELEEQLAIARQREFGASSEQTQSPAQDAESACEDTPSPEAPPRSRAKHASASAGRKPLPDNLPRDEVRHELPPEQRKCTDCNGPLAELSPDVTEELYVVPAQTRVRRSVCANYVCRCCNKISKARMPRRMFSGSSYGSPEFVAHVAVAKYYFGIPLYRQVAMAEAQGMPFNRTTLANLMVAAGDRLTSIYEHMRVALIKLPLIHVDETVLQVLKEPGRTPQSNSYLWAYRSGARTAHQVVMFNYQQTRSGAHAKAFLTDADGNEYAGILHTDGYAGYNRLTASTRVGCMAHIRRNFFEILSSLPHDQRSSTAAAEVVELIGRLYRIERDGKLLSDDQLLELRNRESKPIVAQVKKWLLEHQAIAMPKTALGKAIHYALAQWSAMERYLDDARSPIDNNIIEREIKHVVIGRKNWLFSDTPAGAYASAVLYSLVLTSLANGIDPYRYLVAVISRLPQASSATEVEALLPWNLKHELTVELEPRMKKAA